MGNTASTPASQPTMSEKRAAPSPSSAADLLAHLSLRGSAASRASPKVTSENLAAWEGDFASSPKHQLASTVLSKAALTDSLVRRDAQRDTQQVFSVKVDEGGLPITNQKSSGRCWLFSATNLLRIALARKLDLDDFQFSQSYLFFWDSLSKANYFLEQMLDLADSPLDDRVVQHLMTMPENDGGQWSMLDSLITTFGLVPQTVYPESYNSSNTGKLDALLTSKLREYALELRGLHAAALRAMSDLAGGKTYAEKKALAAQSARKRKEEQMSEVYRMLAIALGQPPKPDDTFVWKYYSKKDKKYHRVVLRVRLSGVRRPQVRRIEARRLVRPRRAHRLASLGASPRHLAPHVEGCADSDSCGRTEPDGHTRVSRTCSAADCVDSVTCARIPPFTNELLFLFRARSDSVQRALQLSYLVPFRVPPRGRVAGSFAGMRRGSS